MYVKNGISEGDCSLSSVRVLETFFVTVAVVFCARSLLTHSWHRLCVNLLPQVVVGYPYCHIDQETVRLLREVPDWASYQQDFLHNLLSMFKSEKFIFSLFPL